MLLLFMEEIPQIITLLLTPMTFRTTYLDTREVLNQAEETTRLDLLTIIPEATSTLDPFLLEGTIKLMMRFIYLV